METLQNSLFHFFQYSEDGIFITAENGKIIGANPKMHEVCGYPPDELTGCFPADIGIREQKSGSAELIRRDGTQIPVTVTFRDSGTDGTHYAHWTVKLGDTEQIIFDEGSLSYTLHTTVIDEPTAVNVWSLDREYRYTFFNENHKQAMKNVWNADIRLGAYILDYIPNNEYREGVERNYRKILSGEPQRSVDYFASLKGGGNYYENFGQPILDSEKNVVGIMFYTIDVTRRKETEHRLKHTVSVLESIMNSPESLHIFSLDKEYKYIFFNHAHINAIRDFWQAEPRFGESIFDILPDPDHRKRVKAFYDRSLKGEIVSGVNTLHDQNGNERYYENISAPIQTKDGTVTGITVFTLEITERVEAERKIRDSLLEKEVLLKEIHHRVKNNLQLIASMISLQIGMMQEETAGRILRDTLNRINTMAFIHTALYQGDSLLKIDMDDYIRPLIDSVLELYKRDSFTVEIQSEFHNITLEIDQAIPIGLIINELLTNSMKYAFSEAESGSIHLSLEKTGEHDFHLQVKDNGTGFPGDFEADSLDTLGFQLISSLTSQLNGRMEISSPGGAAVDIYFS